MVLRPTEPKQLPSLDDEEVREILLNPSLMNLDLNASRSLGDLSVVSEARSASNEAVALAELDAKAAAIMESYNGPSNKLGKTVSKWVKSGLGRKPGKGKSTAKDQSRTADPPSTVSELNVGSSGATPSENAGWPDAIARTRPASVHGPLSRPSTAAASFVSSAAPGSISTATLSRAPSVMTISMVHDICSYLKVSLVQLVTLEESDVNSSPRVRRRAIAHADLEEVDVSTLFNGEDTLDAAGLDSDAALAVQQARKHGWRVVQGLIRLGADMTPGLKAHGVALRVSTAFRGRRTTYANADMLSSDSTPSKSICYRSPRSFERMSPRR